MRRLLFFVLLFAYLFPTINIFESVALKKDGSLICFTLCASHGGLSSYA